MSRTAVTLRLVGDGSASSTRWRFLVVIFARKLHVKLVVGHMPSDNPLSFAFRACWTKLVRTIQFGVALHPMPVSFIDAEFDRSWKHGPFSFFVSQCSGFLRLTFSLEHFVLPHCWILRQSSVRIWLAHPAGPVACIVRVDGVSWFSRFSINMVFVAQRVITVPHPDVFWTSVSS